MTKLKTWHKFPQDISKLQLCSEYGIIVMGVMLVNIMFVDILFISTFTCVIGLRKHRHVFLFSIISEHIPVVDSKFHGCWWLRNTRRPAIASDSIDLVCPLYSTLSPKRVNTLWPSDTIWWQRSGSTSAQVMACCLTTPNYLDQWLIIS